MATNRIRKSFAFLEDIRNRFVSQFGDLWRNAIALQMNNEFSRTLQRQADYFSFHASDRIDEVQNQIESTKEVVIQNIDKILERGDRIELLVQKTEDMQQESYMLKTKSTNLKDMLWWKNMKLNFIIAGIILLIILIAVWAGCGFPAFQKCRSHNGPSPNPSPGPQPTSTV
eukprot:TRINITY_DN1020_c0_g1_i1.p2 TRINITY_DN1020_c0_g1~~TRINITY_DN1020_c0_g1_i1.p2  ORF type:complete len:171 (+),score=32.67 TRINITY_DN1020_c0_g1_i1:479-991(+)